MEEKYSENKIDYSQSDNKIVKWFRNYWYYYKWTVIGIAFALFVIIFCTLQTCSSDSPDITFLYAGTFPPADMGVVEMEKALLMGDFQAAASHMLPVLLYSVLAAAAAVACFLRQMKKQ